MAKSKARYELRAATVSDIDQMVELSGLCYPDEGEGLLVWRPEQLASQLRMFPEGQLVVTQGDRVVGSASALIISLGRDPYRVHTFLGITDNGMFHNHDPFGKTLYCGDINVHPDNRRRGIARMIYEHRRELCRRLNLRRMLLGGRISGYHAVADTMPAEEYAGRVEAGDLVDPVLTPQLKVGFTLQRVLPGYLLDAPSADYGTLLEWVNPDYRMRARQATAIRVSCVQYRMRKISNFEGFARQVRYFVDVAAGYDSDFILFPELMTAQLMSFIRVKTPQEAIRRLTDYTERLDQLFVELAHEYKRYIVGGSHPTQVGDRILNIASLYQPDGIIHRQPKLHVTPNERRWWGIDGGSTLRVFQTPKARVGILVCYDIEFPEAARYLADQGAEVIFVPFCTDDRQAYLRVRYCAQARAVENQVYVALAGTVGNLPDTENMDIQYAQSAVLSPSDFPFARDGILAEANANTETVITVDLDLEALEEAINAGSVRQRRDRRPDLFGYSVTLPEPDEPTR